MKSDISRLLKNCKTEQDFVKYKHVITVQSLQRKTLELIESLTDYEHKYHTRVWPEELILSLKKASVLMDHKVNERLDVLNKALESSNK